MGSNTNSAENETAPERLKVQATPTKYKSKDEYDAGHSF